MASDSDQEKVAAEKLQSAAVARLNSCIDPDVAKVLVLYTGGTIGMVTVNGTYVPQPHCLVDLLKSTILFHAPSKKKYQNIGEEKDFLYLQKDETFYWNTCSSLKDRKSVLYHVMEFDPLLDSSNMAISDWVKIAKCIKEDYHNYDGFVVLHGTDTMAYTASALSFMCENQGKPIILTGSQIPIFESRSDGRDNFLSSLIIAGNYNIPEVLICFNEKVYRGNRCSKWDSGSFSAFVSPNMPPLITMEIEIKVDWQAVYRACAVEKFTIHISLCPNVGLLRIFPGITYQIVKAFLQPPVQGIVLQTYGAGNAPNNRKDLLDLFKDACNWGVLILNISQCNRGRVKDVYATGQSLSDAGIIMGGDMTPEAALTKLSYVLGKEDWSLDKKRKMLARSIRGEMTVVSEQELSPTDSEFIDSFARFMSLNTKEEILKVKTALYPSLMCSAAKSNDIPTLQNLHKSGGNLGAQNPDGRTPLHIACQMGHINVVHYLLNHGVSVHSKDYRGDTPLVDATEGCHLEIIKLLLQTGAVLPLTSNHIAIRMCSAVAHNNVQIIEAWLTAGADPNCADYDKRTALHVAVSSENEDIVRLLLKSGADPDLEDSFGFTCKSIAEKLQLTEIVSLCSNKSQAD